MMIGADIDEIKGLIRYPLPPTAFGKWADEMDIYVRFMRHVRASNYTKAEQRIFSAIQVAAVGMGRGDAETAMILVDLGLRAPRGAFPAEFLYMADQAVCRLAMWGQEPGRGVRELVTYWRGHRPDIEFTPVWVAQVRETAIPV